MNFKKTLTFGIFVFLFLVFWNVLDYLIATFITRSGYQFTSLTDMLIPTVSAIIMGYVLFLRKD